MAEVSALQVLSLTTQYFFPQRLTDYYCQPLFYYVNKCFETLLAILMVSLSYTYSQLDFHIT